MAKTSLTCDLETIYFTDTNPAATLPSNKTCPLLDAALVVLTNNLHPFVPHTLPIKYCLGRLQNCELPLSKLGFQRFNVSTPDVGSHSFFSRLLFQICSLSLVVSTPVATRSILAFCTFNLAPKPVVKNCCPLDSCSKSFVECRLGMSWRTRTDSNNVAQTHRRRQHKSTRSLKVEHTIESQAQCS